MNWKVLAGVAIVLVIVIIGGVFIFREGIIFLPASKPKLSEIKNVVDANNQFALDYYFKLKSKDSGNIFFSPFSISRAFVMTYEGAKGQTAEEMRSVFYFPDNSNLRRTEYVSIFGEVNKNDKKYKLNSANALWGQQDYQFSKNFFDNVEKYYGGKATSLDFKNNPEGSRITINSWVENQTNNKIQNLIPAGVIKTMTRLVLTNAVYFKGEWVKQFSKNDTKEENFRTSSGTVKTQMMQQTDNEATFNYVENSNLQILEMPYSGDELSILFLLPKSDNLTKLEGMLSTKKILDWKHDLKEQRVKVYIPKFKFETKYFMAGDLGAMGMPLAFSDSADFSGMTATGKKDLKIDEAIHQAFVEINEEGTEAAAATAVVMVPIVAVPRSNKEPKIPVFRADHPFIFLIQQKSTGGILFIGRVVNPNL